MARPKGSAPVIEARRHRALRLLVVASMSTKIISPLQSQFNPDRHLIWRSGDHGPALKIVSKKSHYAEFICLPVNPRRFDALSLRQELLGP